MARYWKLLGALLVVGVLAAVMVAAVPAVKPDQGESVPRLILLFEDETIPVASQVTTPFLNTHDCGSLSIFYESQMTEIDMELIISAVA